MKISGYTFVRNATKLAYPLKESILSILDIVDEFVIAYCPGDEDDKTLDVINAIDSDKIKIFHTEWEPERFKRNTLYAYLSDVAKEHCQGDWLFYLQVDEVIHEQDQAVILAACRNYLNRPEIEGLLFNYRHFWGDYDHCFTHHGWYPKEIRIIRNIPEIHSWRDAQSFRKYQDFKPTTKYYSTKKGTEKLKVSAISAYVYHYGWVRHPVRMREKYNRFVHTYNPDHNTLPEDAIDYGQLAKVPKFKGTHPAIMQEKIKELNWQNLLQKSGKRNTSRQKHKHEKIKYRLRSWLEINFLGGREISGFQNYQVVDKFQNK